MSQAEVITDMRPIGSGRTLPRSLVVLIEVPELKTRSIAQVPRTVARRIRRVGRQVPPPRRRLRREIRLASCALIALVPLVSACTLGWSNRPDRILACSISDPLQTEVDREVLAVADRSTPANEQTRPATTSPGAVVLSIEPATAVPENATEAAVIFPGYVLPDDSREDSLHEGS